MGLSVSHETSVSAMQLISGAIGMTGKNRWGKKKKNTLSAARQRKPQADYRALVAAQPHRNWLPAAVRESERAESVLGSLNLLKRISDEMYGAGRRFAVIVGAYRQAIGAPRGMVGNGRGYVCAPDTLCRAKPNNCICKARTAKYRDATHALQLAGQKAYNITYQVAISDIPCGTADISHLKAGLGALAKAFGLTNHRK